MIVDEINLTRRMKMGTAKKIEFKIGDQMVFKNKWGYTTSGPIIEFIDMPTLDGDVPAIVVEAKMVDCDIEPIHCMMSIKSARKELNRFAVLMGADAYIMYNKWQEGK